MDEISEYFLLTVIDGGHFGFYALQNSAHVFLRGVGAFFTNTSNYLKQLLNLICQRLVMESWFWTVLIRKHYILFFL